MSPIEKAAEEYTCPSCASIMRVTKKGYKMGEILAGPYEAVKCDVCGKHFYTDKGLTEIIRDFELLKKNHIIDLSPRMIMTESFTKSTTDSMLLQTQNYQKEMDRSILSYDIENILLTDMGKNKLRYNRVVLPDV